MTFDIHSHDVWKRTAFSRFCKYCHHYNHYIKSTPVILSLQVLYHHYSHYMKSTSSHCHCRYSVITTVIIQIVHLSYCHCKYSGITTVIIQTVHLLHCHCKYSVITSHYTYTCHNVTANVIVTVQQAVYQTLFNF